MARITEVFYKTEREKAKANATHSMSYDYIEALEEIALAAYETWKHFNPANKPDATTVKNVETLYDKLVAVNFMDETME